MSSLQKGMYRRNLSLLPPSFRRCPNPDARSNYTVPAGQADGSATSDTEHQPTLMPGMVPSLVPNVATPSPSEEFWDLFNQRSHRAESGNITGSVTRDDGYCGFVQDGDAAWSGSQTLEEESATDPSSQTPEQNNQNHNVREGKLCQDRDAKLGELSASLEHDPRQNELAQPRADTHSNPEIFSNPSQRLKVDPRISDNPKTIDTRRSRAFNTAGWQTASSSAEPSVLSTQISTLSPLDYPTLAMTGACKKRTREGEIIDHGNTIPPIRIPETRTEFLPEFDALRISTREKKNNDPDVVNLHIASLREIRNSLVEQIAGSEERKKVAKRSEEFDARCKKDETQCGGQLVLCRLIVEKERIEDEIKHAKRYCRGAKNGRFRVRTPGCDRGGMAGQERSVAVNAEKIQANSPTRCPDCRVQAV
jgi:hypothetical protein